MSTLYVKNSSGVWTLVPDGTAVSVKNGGAWVNPTSVSVKNSSGVWTTVWNKSDPVTYNFNITDVETFDSTGWNPTGTANYGYIGSFGTSAERVAVFNYGVNSLWAIALATRPVVKSASLTLKRDTSSGTNNFTDTLYLGLYTGTFNSGAPSYSNLDFSPNLSRADTYTQGSTYTFNLGTTFGQEVANDLAVGGIVNIAMSGVSSGWSTAGGTTDNYWSRWQGPSTGYTPVLSITLDYS